jgi:spermidine/putrescine-binding protein
VANSAQSLSVPLQPGIATEIFRRCLTEPFAKAFGVTVDTPPRSERFLQDVQEDMAAGRRSFDVVEWPQLQFEMAKRRDMCVKLDYASMPNLAEMHQRYLDPGMFGVGVFVYGLVPVYVPGLVPRSVGSWADLWAPEFKNKIALRDQIMSNQLMAITCKVLGISMAELRNSDTFERAWAKLAELVRNAGHWADSEGHVQEIISSRQAAVSQQFIDVAQIQKDRGVEIEVVFPSEGPVWAYRSWTIVKGSRNVELAREFINFVQGAGPQKDLAESFFGHPTNSTVKLDERLIPRIYGGRLAEADLSFPEWDWYLERTDIEERWSRLFA